MKDVFVEKLVTLAYFWIGSENYYCSYNVLMLLKELKEVSHKNKERIDGLEHDWNTLFGIKYKKEEIEIIPIPNNYALNDDLKIHYILCQTIMNLIQAGEMEMAYIYITDCAQEKEEIYRELISMIGKSKMKEPFTEWLLLHTMLAYDINGKKDMEFLGIKVEMPDSIE